MKNINIVFMGTPQFASTALESLYTAGYNISGVITRPGKKSGRGRNIEPSAVKEMASKLHLPIFQPVNKEELIREIIKLKPELIIVAAYGMIIPEKVLSIPKYETLNIHGSLLPKYRGGSCIEEAILNENETGITIMKIVAKMDAGPIISQVKTRIEKSDTKEALKERLAKVGANEIVRIIPKWIDKEIYAKDQVENNATYCKLINKEDGKIDWSKSAEYIERMTRAYYPWPTAYSYLNGKLLKIISAKVVDKKLRPGEIIVDSGSLFVGTGKNALEIIKIQPEGKKEMPAKDYLNGNKSISGKIFD